MNIEGKTVWQTAAGDGKDTDYAQFCLQHGVVIFGPGRYGAWPDCEMPMRADGWKAAKVGIVRRFAEDVKAGDVVVLRVGTQSIYGVGEVVEDYGWDESFADVQGWDLQHFRHVRWLWHQNGEPETFPAYTLKFGSSVQHLVSPVVRQWLMTLDVSAEPVSAAVTKDVIEEMEKKVKVEKEAGHVAHTKGAAELGLPGEMRRPIKVTMLGAGSGFTPTLVNDILRIPGEQGGTIALVDVDTHRLATMHRIIQGLLQQLGKTNWTVEASPDRTQVLPGSDYLVCCIEVSGTACVRWDNDIPARYGIDQCIGDTIGPGGLFKGLRTVPVFLDVLRDAERLCPQALVLNYTNPMNMMCLAAGRTSPVPVVGLCHSVQGTSHLLAKRAGVAYEEMTWECAGINHLAWFTRLEHRGRDLYPVLKGKAARDLAGDPADLDDAKDLVRKDMMLHFGAFITESSGHLSEYLPYYRKRKDVMAQYARDGYDGGSSFYADNWPQWRQKADALRDAQLRGDEPIAGKERSWEYGSWIIEAREKDRPVRIHGNVMNSVGGAGALITNLPADGCVEVACLVDQNGVSPTRYGRLPPQMAALCDSNMRVFDLAAQAVITRSKEAAIHALLLDPLCAAVCSPAEIKAMTLEMFEAERDYLPGYR